MPVESGYGSDNVSNRSQSTGSGVSDGHDSSVVMRGKGQRNQRADQMDKAAALQQSGALSDAADLLGIHAMAVEEFFLATNQSKDDWAKVMQALSQVGIDAFPSDGASNVANADARLEAKRLRQQLGKYPSNQYVQQVSQFVSDSQVAAALDSGISDYLTKRAGLITKYGSKYSALHSSSPTVFREAFINLVLKKQFEGGIPNYDGDTALREQHPSKAAVSLKKLFGLDGAFLYQLALEEEVNSPEFRRACLADSLGSVPCPFGKAA